MPDSVLFASASSERIEFNMGTLVGTGAYTIAAVIKHTTVSAFTGYCGWHAGNFVHRAAIGVDASGNVQLVSDGGNTFDTGDPITTGNGWVIVAVTKASGSVVPRVHIYRSPTWRHAAMGSAVGNAAAATGFIISGTDPAEDYHNGNVLIAAAWDSALADLAVEGLSGGYLGWVEAAPKEGIRVNALTGLASFVAGGTMSETGHTGGTVDTGDIPSWWSDDLARPTYYSKFPLFTGARS